MPFRRWSFQTRLIMVACIFSLAYYFSISSEFVIRWQSERRTSYHVRDRSLHDISNATLGFQKLFVINMPSRTDRRDAVDLAATTTGLKFDFINGVGGDTIPESAFPPGGSSDSIKLSKGIKGSWRSHMNALNAIVHQNLTTAVIFEDDMDWDIRLREQLERFALASRFLTDPIPKDFSKYPLEKSPNPEDPDLSIHNDSSTNVISLWLHSLPLSQATQKSSPSSPYGNPENWDVLWLGHCGVGFPRQPASESAPSMRNVLLTDLDDITVPVPRHLRAHPFGPLDALSTSHPAHTRVFHRASGGALCTVAYAVSQRGARRLLHEFSVKQWSKIWDAELGAWCAGSDFAKSEFEDVSETGKVRKQREKLGERKCITSQPPVFGHHHPPGGESDIGGLGGGYARNVETKYVRLSVRMNLDALIRGEGVEGVVDQWPD